MVVLFQCRRARVVVSRPTWLAGLLYSHVALIVHKDHLRIWRTTRWWMHLAWVWVLFRAESNIYEIKFAFLQNVKLANSHTQGTSSPQWLWGLPVTDSVLRVHAATVTNANLRSIYHERGGLVLRARCGVGKVQLLPWKNNTCLHISSTGHRHVCILLLHTVKMSISALRWF